MTAAQRAREKAERKRTETNGAIAIAEAPSPSLIAMLVSDVARLDTPPIRSYPTGNPQLDELIGGGASTRQLTAILGIPGAGKSAFVVSLALHIGLTIPALYASTELESHEVMARLGGNVIDRPWSAIVRGDVPMTWVREAVEGRRIYIIGCEVLPRDGDAALMLIESQARMLAELHGIAPLVIVDYLQDLARGSDRDLKSRVGDIASVLRAMSQRLDCALVGVSSVSRNYYSARRAAELREADDPTVYLAAAKESGDVDYAAACVMFLDVDTDEGKASRPARIAVAKSRHGRTGFAGSHFFGASGRWIAEPDAVAALSAPGRAHNVASERIGEADAKVLRAVNSMHASAQRELCTYSHLRTACGLDKERVKPALERLVHSKRLRLVSIERSEGDPPKLRKREIYDLPLVARTEPTPAATPSPQEEFGDFGEPFPESRGDA